MGEQKFSAQDCIVCTNGIAKFADTYFKQQDRKTVIDFIKLEIVVCDKHYTAFRNAITGLVIEKKQKEELSP